MHEIKSRVYILVDAKNRITRCEGEYSLPADLTGWTLIEEGPPCDRLNLAQTHYFEGGMTTTDGLYRYKLSNGVPVLRTDAELAADRAALPAPPPSDAEKMSQMLLMQAQQTQELTQLKQTNAALMLQMAQMQGGMINV